MPPPGLTSFVSAARHLFVVLVFPLVTTAAMGQQTSQLPDAPKPNQTQPPAQNGQQHEPSKNHIFWVIPNYRSDESSGASNH